MAASLGVATGPGRAGGGYLFHFVCAFVLARTASVFREGCKDPRSARATAHARALFHHRDPLLRCGRTESGGAAVDSDLRRGCIIWWALWIGMDVEPAPWSAHPQHSIANAGNQTLLGMADRGSGPGNSVHRGN